MVSDENIKEITHLIDSLRGYEKELNLTKYNETEKKVFWTIVCTVAKRQKCNISDVINFSNLSRSTVYKTITKFEKENLLKITQSGSDKREFLITLIK